MLCLYRNILQPCRHWQDDKWRNLILLAVRWQCPLTLDSVGAIIPDSWVKAQGNYLLSFSYPVCCCCCCVASVMSNSVQPHRRQPTGLPHPWDFPGKSTGMGCHCLLPYPVSVLKKKSFLKNLDYFLTSLPSFFLLVIICDDAVRIKLKESCEIIYPCSYIHKYG